MPPQEQADLWMALRDRMKVNWEELTLQEKKAGSYIHRASQSACTLRVARCAAIHARAFWHVASYASVKQPQQCVAQVGSAFWLTFCV